MSLRPVLAVGLADLAARLAPHVTPASIGAAPASRFRTGTGSPEGVVTAPVGTTYKDTATGNEWHKMSGTGVTGWRGPIVLSDDPRLVDSGTIRLDSAIITANGYTGGQIHLTRIGQVCSRCPS